MIFQSGERVITKNDPVLHTGTKGTVAAAISPDAGNEQLNSVATVYEVRLDDNDRTVRITGMYLELLKPKICEAIIDGATVHVRQDDDGSRWMITFHGGVSGSAQYAKTESEAKEMAHTVTHFLLTKRNNTCVCPKPPAWKEISETEEDRLKKLLW